MVMQSWIYKCLVVFLLAIAGCASVSQFDQHAYVQVTSLKVDALNVMSSATDSYAQHEAEVRAINTMLDRAYEYERNRPNNTITLQLWDKLRDTNGHLYGGFVRRWRNEGTLRPAFVRESGKQVGESFDIIAQLESKKIKPKQIPK